MDAETEECDDGNSNDEDACLSSCLLARCGDTVIWFGHETCDDGNTDDADSCPSDCVVDSCTPTGGTDVPVSVTLAGTDVGAVTVLVDYPEGKVSIPGSGAALAPGATGPAAAVVLYSPAWRCRAGARLICVESRCAVAKSASS